MTSALVPITLSLSAYVSSSRVNAAQPAGGMAFCARTDEGWPVETAASNVVTTADRARLT
jgi:hypothetical protein